MIESGHYLAREKLIIHRDRMLYTVLAVASEPQVPQLSIGTHLLPLGVADSHTCSQYLHNCFKAPIGPQK